MEEGQQTSTGITFVKGTQRRCPGRVSPWVLLGYRVVSVGIGLVFANLRLYARVGRNLETPSGAWRN